METIDPETTTTPNNSSNNIPNVKKSMKKRNLGLCNQELLKLT